jgi:hypothetical protein
MQYNSGLVLFVNGQNYPAFSATQYVPEALSYPVRLPGCEYNSLLAMLAVQEASLQKGAGSIDTDLPLS